MLSPIPVAILAAKPKTPEAGFVMIPTTPVTIPFAPPTRQQGCSFLRFWDFA